MDCATKLNDELNHDGLYLQLMLERTERTTTPMKPIMCASPNNLDDLKKKTAKQSNRRNRRRIRNPPEMLIFFRCLIDAPFAIIKLKMRHWQQDMKYETPKYPLQMFRSTPVLHDRGITGPLHCSNPNHLIGQQAEHPSIQHPSVACINYDFKDFARDAVSGLLGCRAVLVQTVSQAHNQPRVVVVQAQVPHHTTASDTYVCM